MQKTPITSAQLHLLLAREDVRALSPKARERLSWLLHYCEHGRSVSGTCRRFGITRVTFYRLLQRFDAGRPETLEDQSRRPHAAGSSLSPASVSFIRECRQRSPQMGKEQIAELLSARLDAQISPSAVGRVIAREGFYFGDTPLHWQKRLEREMTVAGGQGVSREGIPEAVAARTESLPIPATTTQPSVGAACVPSCLLCRLRRCDWSRWKRALFVASVVANLALIGFFLSTVALESHRSAARPLSADLSASIAGEPVPLPPHP